MPTVWKHPGFSSLVLVLFLGAWFQPIAGEGDATRDYAIRGVGTVSMAVPSAWKQAVRKNGKKPPLEIAFSPKDGSSFQMYVSILWGAETNKLAGDRAKLKETVEMSAAEAASQAVEDDLVVQELSGGAALGYYFSATDRAPEPHGYRFMTQGCVGAGDVALTFTILTNDAHSSVLEEGMAMMRSVVFVPR